MPGAGRRAVADAESAGEGPGNQGQNGEASGEGQEPPPPVGHGQWLTLLRMITECIHPHALSMQDGPPARPATRRPAGPPGHLDCGLQAAGRARIRTSASRTAREGEGEAGASTSMTNSYAEPVLRWYAVHARDLPWRRPGASAWSVLVSEIMLQQTPVARVLPAHAAWL